MRFLSKQETTQWMSEHGIPVSHQGRWFDYPSRLYQLGMSIPDTFPKIVILVDNLTRLWKEHELKKLGTLPDPWKRDDTGGWVRVEPPFEGALFIPDWFPAIDQRTSKKIYELMRGAYGTSVPDMNDKSVQLFEPSELADLRAFVTIVAGDSWHAYVIPSTPDYFLFFREEFIYVMSEKPENLEIFKEHLSSFPFDIKLREIRRSIYFDAAGQTQMQRHNPSDKDQLKSPLKRFWWTVYKFMSKLNR